MKIEVSKFNTGPDNIQEKYAKGLNERNKSDKLNEPHKPNES